MVKTRSLIDRQINPGCRNSAVKNLQLLLRAAAIRQQAKGNDTLVRAAPKVGRLDITDWAWADGDWGANPKKVSATTVALHKFQEIARIPITDTVAPSDTTVMRLAEEAEILFDISLKDDFSGVLDLNNNLCEATYEPGADGKGSPLGCIFYGLQGFPRTVVQLQLGGNFNQGPPEQIQPGPIQMNCTTYANIAMSVYMNGTVQIDQYNPDVHEIGDYGPHLAHRYGFALMVKKDAKVDASVFRTAEEIEEYVKPGTLYSIECAGGRGGGVHHEAVMYDNIVYHSYPMGYAPTILDDTLDEFVDRLQGCFFYLYQEPLPDVPVFGGDKPKAYVTASTVTVP